MPRAASCHASIEKRSIDITNTMRLSSKCADKVPPATSKCVRRLTHGAPFVRSTLVTVAPIVRRIPNFRKKMALPDKTPPRPLYCLGIWRNSIEFKATGDAIDSFASPVDLSTVATVGAYFKNLLLVFFRVPVFLIGSRSFGQLLVCVLLGDKNRNSIQGPTESSMSRKGTVWWRTFTFRHITFSPF